MPLSVAFFAAETILAKDIDLVDFLLYWGHHHGDEESVRATVHKALEEMAGGHDTAMIVRALHGLLEGADHRSVHRAASKWFTQRTADGVSNGTPVLNPAARETIEHHRTDGDLIALVSMSLHVCLDPVVVAVDAHAGLAAEPVVADGRILVDIAEPLVDRSGLAAATAFAGEHDVPLERCHAYGAGAVDLPMLQAVGHPHVVGIHPILVAAARQEGWPVICWDDSPARGNRRAALSASFGSILH